MACEIMPLAAIRLMRRAPHLASSLKGEGLIEFGALPVAGGLARVGLLPLQGEVGWG